MLLRIRVRTAGLLLDSLYIKEKIIITQEEKSKYVIFHGPATPLNVLIKTDQLLTFGLCLSVNRIEKNMKLFFPLCKLAERPSSSLILSK